MKYRDLQDRFKIKIGEKVKIVHKPTEYEIKHIWQNGWVDEEMDPTIGLMGTVIDIGNNGILVSVPGHPGPKWQKGCWAYPYFSLAIIR